MNVIGSIASVFACILAANAQVTGSLRRLPDGQDEVRIRNDSSLPLIAFAVTAKQVPFETAASTSPLVVYADPLIDTKVAPVATNEERVVMRRGGTIWARNGLVQLHLEPPIIAAGIFEDGSTAGDPVLVTRLVSRRGNMLLAVETTLELLMDAGRRNIPRDQLIAQFQRIASSMNRGYLSPEQQVGRALYQSITGKLINLPQGELGSPFPPADFVAKEIAVLNRQRVALSESQPSLIDAALLAGVRADENPGHGK